MTFVGSSSLAKKVAAKVNDDGKASAGQVNVITEVDKKWASTATTSLNDLFHHESSLTGNTFRTTF